MTGVLSWLNRCWDGTASDPNTAAYMSSAPANAKTKHLFDNYKFVGTSNQVVLEFDLDATYTERMAVGICGLETSSAVASAATFTVNLYEDSSLQEAVSVSALDANRGTIVALASQSYAVNRVELAIAANDSDSWLGIGALWVGPCMVIGEASDALLDKGLQVTPLNRDYVTRTPGNQAYTRETERYRRLDMGLFNMAQNLALQREAVNAIGAAWHYAGNSKPVLFAATTNRSDASAYGMFVGNAPIANQPTSLWLQQLGIEERG